MDRRWLAEHHERVLAPRSTEPAKAKPRDILSLLHPLPVIITVAAAMAIALASRSTTLVPGELVKIIVIVLTSQLTISIFNDIRDVKLDVVAHPHRPLARGSISVPTAYALVVIAALTAELLALSQGALSLTLVSLGTGLGLIYSLWFKQSVLSFLPFALAFPLLPLWELSLIRPNMPGLWTLEVIGIPAAIAIHFSDSLPDRQSDILLGRGGMATKLTEKHAVLLMRAALALAGVLCLMCATITARPEAGFAAAAVALIAALWMPFKSVDALGRYGIPLAATIMGALWILALAN